MQEQQRATESNREQQRNTGKYKYRAARVALLEGNIKLGFGTLGLY
jgi:hypothetical protein